jgi:hypothetical protein
MHLKIQDFISALLINMSEDEKAIFLTEGRKSADYMELYRIYIDSKNDKSLLKKLAEFKVGKTAEAFNDLNSELYKKLLLFLSENDKQNEDEIKILTSIIDMVNVLIKRKLFNQASVELRRAYRILKTIEANEFNYHLYLQYLNLVLKLQKPPYKTSNAMKLQKDFEEIETISWLNRLSYYAAKHITTPENIDDVDFSKNIFFNLLGNYYLENENYEAFNDWVGENIALKMNSFFKEYETNEKLDESIKSIKILTILEAIYSGYKLNNKEITDHHVNILKNEIFSTRDAHYQTFAFLLLHIHDIQLKMNIASNIPIDEYYFDTPITDLKLFSENEIANIAIRLEVNKGIILLYNKDFRKAQEIFNGMDTKKIKSAELRYYMKFFELLAYLSIGYNNFQIDNFNKRIQYLIELKNKKSAYSKGLLKLIEKHELTYEIGKYIKGFQNENKALSLYDIVLENWTFNFS